MSSAFLLLFARPAFAQTNCTDLSGVWHNSGSVQMMVTVNGTPQPQPPQTIDETFELVQTNCKVSRVGFPDSGTVSNNILTMAGPWLVGSGCDSYYTYIGNIKDNQVDWTEHIAGGCSGPGYVVVITGSGSGSMTRQIANAPALKISLLATNVAVISWPASTNNFILETSASLSRGVSWISASGTALQVGDEMRWTNAAGGAAAFYRLRKP